MLKISAMPSPPNGYFILNILHSDALFSLHFLDMCNVCCQQRILMNINNSHNELKFSLRISRPTDTARLEMNT